jgi:phosphoribosylformimino-5-aminoimidazole carboxamide ribotide isomerase|tara:strand:+ start:453 stop:1175 length:723 start_codon:yes stop_codon:yes gene_type:complete
MKIIPAIDLKDNKCVRLSKGVEKSSVVYNQNPIDQAKFFQDEGCERVHIVDLDAAFGRKNINKKTIIKIKKSLKIPIQLGGGIRERNDALLWFEEGINFLILGSIAVEKIEETISIASDFENKIYVSSDQLKDKVMIKGWTQQSKISIEKMFKAYNNSKIRGYILTDISRDGMLEGIDTDLVINNLKMSKKPMIVGGGLSSHEDLIKLKKLNNKNLEGVIAGKSFYTGSVNLKESIRILT